jgi:hypothetical protein
MSVCEQSGSRRNSLLFIEHATVLVRCGGRFISPTDPNSMQKNERGFTVYGLRPSAAPAR